MAFDTKNVRAIGTTLTKKKSGSEIADWLIGSLLSIGEIKLEIGEEEITTLDSPDRAKEFMPGDLDAGECTITGLIKKEDDEQTVAKFMGMIEGSKVEEWTVTFPSGATWNFDAFVKSFGTNEASVDGKVEYSGSLRITGKPDYKPSKKD